VSQKKKLNPRDLWPRFSKELGMGMFSRPVRFLVLLNGDMIALMEELRGDSWAIFATEHANGKITKSPVYRMRSVAEVMFREIADEITEPEKERLFKQATAVPYEQASSDQKLRIANDCLEYMRLKTCDDEAVYADRDRAQGFTLEEAEFCIRETLDAYTRQTAQEAAE
jgi:hypothetical protein